MDRETARYVTDLEGRLSALSGIVSVLIWMLRERGVLTAELERRLYCSASTAAGTLPPAIEAAADRLIGALSTAGAAAPAAADRA